MVWCLPANSCCVYPSPATRGVPFWRRLSSHVCVDFGSPTGETEGGDYGLASFNKFMLCIFLASYAGGTVLPVAL